MATRELPDISQFPIPRDVVAGRGWSAQMREMAEHIGAYETLLISERFGGQEIYVPADADKSPFRPLIGAAKAKKLSWIYRRNTLAIPTAGYAIARARRAGILAAVRAGDVTVSDAARMLGIRRDYASKLINQTDEGCGVEPAPIGAAKHDPRQLDMFGSGTTSGD